MRILADRASITPYVGPPSGYVFVVIATDGPAVRLSILDDFSKEIVSALPRSSVALGTIVRPSLRWYTLIENPNDCSVEVTVNVITPLI